MNIIEVIVSGVVQGLTEFIPVSSSGHLVVSETFMTGGADHLFIEFINIGTLLALLVYFRHKLYDIYKSIVKDKSYTLAINLLITSVPAGVIGFLLADFIGSEPFFSSILTVAVALSLVGVIMIYVDKLPKMSAVKSIDGLSPKRALTIGLVQVLALIPGVSRSGSTMITGRLVGLNNESAAEYSFLASIPIMLGVTAKLFLKDHAYLMSNLELVAISNIVAFIAGMFAISFLMKYLSSKGLAAFGWYRLGLASVIFLFILIS